MQWVSNTNFCLIFSYNVYKWIYLSVYNESAKNTYILIKIIKFEWNNYGEKMGIFTAKNVFGSFFSVNEFFLKK